MYKICCILLLFSTQLLSTLEEESSSIQSPELTKEIERFSNREGYMFAKGLKNNIKWVNLSSVVQGIQDYVSGKKLQDELDLEDEPDFCRISFQLFELESKENLCKACLYLQELSSNKNLHVLESGKIVYEIIENGQGDSVVQKDGSPQLKYVISTLNGGEVVNTRECPSPYQVPLTETISGFAKGVEGMRVGERRKIFIHPDFGYGKVGHVPPNSLLIVDVEVVGL